MLVKLTNKINNIKIILGGDVLLKDNIMGTKEVADFLKVSTPALANFRKRYEDFPEPILNLTATPIFDRLDVELWAEKHNRDFHSGQVIGSLGKSLNIAVTGKPRVGKSLTISLFSEQTYVYRDACSKSGDDFTQCAVQNVIREDINEPFAVFHLKKSEKTKTQDDGMDGWEAPLKEERFSHFMQEITDYLKEKKNNGEDLQDEAYVEIFMRPSKLARAIMAENNLETLIITDTPGVSENYKLTPIEKANLIIIVLGDSGKIEAQKSYSELVQGLAPLVATSNVCFLYNIRTQCDDQEEFDDMQKEAQRAMESFSDCFMDLQGKIIDSSIDVLQPEKSVIGIPSLKTKKNSDAEMMLSKTLQEKIIEILSGKDLSLERLRVAIRDAGVTKKEIITVLKDFLAPWRQIRDMEAGIGYFDSFVKEKHDRVKTHDGYRLLFEANRQCRNILWELYKNLGRYTVQELPELWKQMLLKYTYASLTEGVKNDSGIARGEHQWEDTPPITMYVIESILAEPIRIALHEELNNDSSEKHYLDKYIKVMRDNGVTSNSWGYVYIDLSDAWGLLKLDAIVLSGLSYVKTTNLSDLVKYRYTWGLLKMAELNIWKQIFELEEESEKALTDAYTMIQCG